MCVVGPGCLGSESLLEYCPHSAWGTASGCSYSNDAGVICRPENLNAASSSLTLTTGTSIGVGNSILGYITPWSSFSGTTVQAHYTQFSVTVTLDGSSNTLALSPSYGYSSTLSFSWQVSDIRSGISSLVLTARLTSASSTIGNSPKTVSLSVRMLCCSSCYQLLSLRDPDRLIVLFFCGDRLLSCSRLEFVCFM